MHSRISARSYVKTRSWVCKSASKKMMSEGQIIIDHLFGGLLGWRILLSSTKKEKRMSINVSKIWRRLGALHPFASHNGQGRILWGLIQPEITVQGERSLEKQLWCARANDDLGMSRSVPLFIFWNFRMGFSWIGTPSHCIHGRNESPIKYEVVMVERNWKSEYRLKQRRTLIRTTTLIVVYSIKECGYFYFLSK